MIFSTFLWLLTWGGMFSNPYNIVIPSLFSNPIHIILGIRPLLPAIAVYLCLLWIFLISVLVESLAQYGAGIS